MSIEFPPGTLVDLWDLGFNQWRGEYIIVKFDDARELYKIKNTKTNSQQFAREKNLRRGRLAPFKIKSLY